MISIRKISFIIIASGLMINSCKKKEIPLTTPVISTTAVTNISANTASSGGSISSDGGATISSTGICWSNTNTSPTTDDQKIEATVTSGSFISALTNLTSNSTYYVRAYAINSVGTGYGNVVTFTTGNAGPTASNVSIAGEAKVNATLTGVYTYSDSENDLESGTVFKWYVASDATGIGEVTINGANSKTYVVQEGEQGKYIRFGVTPKAATGTLVSTEVKSGFVGAIGEPTTITFMYSGASVTYGILNSAATGRKWLDRNLGASGVPTSVNNYQNYGDLFQWGRQPDGHQLVSRGGTNDADAIGLNGTTDPSINSRVAGDVVDHKMFILASSSPVDWRLTLNNNLWQGVNGTNNPCPAGWRIPTQAEWNAEKISNLEDGFLKLKLTKTGSRFQSDGQFVTTATLGNYWTSTVGTSDVTRVVDFRVDETSVSNSERRRAAGIACRCIKN